MSEMYCILCHGRGLDSRDRTCKRCGGSGQEPDEFTSGYGPAGCQFNVHLLCYRRSPSGTTPGPAQAGGSDSLPRLDLAMQG